MVLSSTGSSWMRAGGTEERESRAKALAGETGARGSMAL